MKLIKFFFCIASLISLETMFSQADEDYSNWLFMQSDKAVQERYALVKQDGDIGYYSVQFRINFSDGIHCSNADCEGYIIAFSYPNNENTTNVYHHFIFYNSFKGIYTLKELMPIKNKFSDGSKRFLSKEKGFMYELADGTQGSASQMFYNCVDNKLKSTTETRCSGRNPWRDIFKQDLAIIIQ